MATIFQSLNEFMKDFIPQTKNIIKFIIIQKIKQETSSQNLKLGDRASSFSGWRCVKEQGTLMLCGSCWVCSSVRSIMHSFG